MAAGTRFEFVQEQFDLTCADLGRYAIACAVAASAAVPVLMSTIMMRNRAGRRGCPGTDAVALGLQARHFASRQLHCASKLRSDFDAEARPCIHLLDGGLADNLGLRSPLEAVFTHDDAWHLVQRLGYRQGAQGGVHRRHCQHRARSAPAPCFVDPCHRAGAAGVQRHSDRSPFPRNQGTARRRPRTLGVGHQDPAQGRRRHDR